MKKNFFPPMKSNNENGIKLTASTSESTIWALFDAGNDSSLGAMWYADYRQTYGQWIQIESEKAICVNEIKIANDDYRGIAYFTLYGSNNGVDFDNLSTQSFTQKSTKEVPAPYVLRWETVKINNNKKYTTYKMVLTGMNNESLYFSELLLIEEDKPTKGYNFII